MIFLQSKPGKKVKIVAFPEQRYRIVFLTELPTEAELREIVEKDIAPSLAPPRVTNWARSTSRLVA